MNPATLVCFAAPPFAPVEIEPGLFELKQRVPDDYFSMRLVNYAVVFMVVVTVWSGLAHLVGQLWPPGEMIMIGTMAAGLSIFVFHIVSYSIRFLFSLLRYRSPSDRERIIVVDTQASPAKITINGDQPPGAIQCCMLTVRDHTLWFRKQTVPAICVIDGKRTTAVICPEDKRAMNTWARRLGVSNVTTSLTRRGHGVLWAH